MNIDLIQRKVSDEILKPRYGEETMFNQSYLRRTAELTAGVSSLEFNLSAAQITGASDGINKGLLLTDHFYATHIAIYLLAQDPAKPGTGDLRTAPLNESQEVVYNGEMNIKLNTQDVITGMDCRRFRKVGEYIGLTDATTREYDQNEFSDGLVQLARYITFKGDETNKVIVNLAAPLPAAALTGLSPRKLFLVFAASGLLISGGVNAQVKTAK